MSKRFFTYKLVSPEGYEVDYSTFEESATALKDKHFEEVMFWEKEGWSLKKVSNAVPAVQQPLESTTQDLVAQVKHCQQCGAVMEYRTGVSPKTGKPWKGFFCTGPDKGHPVQWVK